MNIEKKDMTIEMLTTPASTSKKAILNPELNKKIAKFVDSLNNPLFHPAEVLYRIASMIHKFRI